MHSVLPSLATLLILNCPELESFPEGGLPSQLQDLTILDCNKLIANHMQWDLQSLHSLSLLAIAGYKDAVSFPEETLLPSTLTTLKIRNFENLKSLEYKGFHHLTSLRKFYIWDCPNLQSMPEEGLPSSLTYLAIGGCPLLEKKCEKETGEYWPKISHIPSIEIDYKNIN
ncbi:unnamed protein product [Dovyalis caffra]|uniref:Uncharacterized protein n=1 Tax=Dovyalis caffra TaxID=77055 RepID=A0AAV1QW71_9ROSI|nr:unnamed protein product [Dovyalis caffra]